MREGGSTLAADMSCREPIFGGVGFGGGRGLLALARRLAFRAQNKSTATQQGAAPDRLQLRSFLTSLPAAGELGRSAAARGVTKLLLK